MNAQRLIHGFHAAKRDLAMAVDPALFADIEGSTDSELFFYLALTFGLEDDPPAAVAGAVGLIEETGRRHGEAFPMQTTVATTDGESLYGFRYSSEGRSRSLFHSTDISTLREQYPDNPLLRKVTDDARLVVSPRRRYNRSADHAVPRLMTETLTGFPACGRWEVLHGRPHVDERVGLGGDRADVDAAAGATSLLASWATPTHQPAASDQHAPGSRG